MQCFTSASLDRAHCLNMRHQDLHLQDMTCPSITRIRLGPTNLSVDEIQNLPAALEYLEWDMGNATVPDDDTLRALFQRSSIAHLRLRFRNRRVIQSLKRCLPYAEHLQGLDLRGNLIGDDGIADLVEEISRSNLKSLKLGLNCITDRGAAHLARLVSLPSCQLTHLDLNSNLIGNAGGYELAIALKDNSTLKTFLLCGNAQVSCGGVFVECLQANDSLIDCNLQQTHLELCEVSVINYWLMLNKCGRKILKNDSLPCGVWPEFLEKHACASQHPDVLFYFLSQKPDLVPRRCCPVQH